MTTMRGGLYIVACVALLACGKVSPGGDQSASPPDAGPAVVLSSPADASANPSFPPWAKALTGKSFDFVSAPGNSDQIQGTLTFGSGPVSWAADRKFLWFDAVDDVRHLSSARWIELKTIVDGFDVKGFITNESVKGGTLSPLSGHKMRVRVAIPAGSVTELDFENGIPLVLKWDAASETWTASTPAR